MAFERHDNKGSKQKSDKHYIYKKHALNMLDKSQCAMNEVARAGYDATFTDKQTCKVCEFYSKECDTCFARYSQRPCVNG